ncbi:hypothetical protein KFK09_010372 [Dendrobium nobile]|uniref:Uncharacterized protein n=1 Tax=Dendrobium nobile TaxID=94219 RepID=A0A8T3B9V9_DENNO|nr:hypothetical protein KFK09_010372 [Dendrobium nobile]
MLPRQTQLVWIRSIRMVYNLPFDIIHNHYVFSFVMLFTPKMIIIGFSAKILVWQHKVCCLGRILMPKKKILAYYVSGHWLEKACGLFALSHLSLNQKD